VKVLTRGDCQVAEDRFRGCHLSERYEDFHFRARVPAELAVRPVRGNVDVPVCEPGVGERVESGLLQTPGSVCRCEDVHRSVYPCPPLNQFVLLMFSTEKNVVHPGAAVGTAGETADDADAAGLFFGVELAEGGFVEERATVGTPGGVGIDGVVTIGTGELGVQREEFKVESSKFKEEATPVTQSPDLSTPDVDPRAGFRHA